MKTVMAIALGGALGAVAGLFISHWSVVALGNGFPWGTLTVNVVGCFALGVMALVWSPAAELRAFLTVGVLGALQSSPLLHWMYHFERNIQVMER